MIKIYEANYLSETPDTSSGSGYADIVNSIVHTVLSRLRKKKLITMSDWDNKGTKFTIRLENKTVIVKIPQKLNGYIKFINDQTKNEDTYKLTYNYDTDEREIMNKIIAV